MTQRHSCTTMITLWQATDPRRAVAFDRKNVIGLHHLALIISENGSLDALHRDLVGAPEVTIELATEPLNGGPTRHMMCNIPGGTRVEFIAPAV